MFTYESLKSSKNLTITEEQPCKEKKNFGFSMQNQARGLRWRSRPTLRG